MLNFPVPVEAIATIAPMGTEPDMHDRQAYISVIGFRFHAVRLYGLAVPGHTDFPEINLRYYVRRRVGNAVRRGVVFVREIVPRRAVAFSANWLYNENYITRPMQTSLQMVGSELGTNDTVEYGWQSGGGLGSRSRPQAQPSRPHRGQLQGGQVRWNRLAGRVGAPLAIPATGSLEEFIVEHYWGYARARNGTTTEYRVAHIPWKVALADSVTWECDRPATYDTPLAEYLKQSPTSAIVANGSTVEVYRGGSVRC
jgi:uncharacterized protein YqjF (DUF2071 family)